jgi:hypothetical protein
MKTQIVIAGVLSALTATGAFAADQTWKGAISDKMCGADHKKMAGKMSDRECTQACTKGGSSYVLVVDGKVYQLMNHDADLRTHAGHVVNLTGELKGDTIRVSTVEMPATSK